MQRKHTLLIIEDNSEIRAYICSLFRTKYTLLEADQWGRRANIGHRKSTRPYSFGCDDACDGWF